MFGGVGFNFVGGKSPRVSWGMKDEKNNCVHKEKLAQVGRGYPESKPVETATSVTDDPFGNESEGSSPACEAGT
jgi:hypothetical protein